MNGEQASSDALDRFEAAAGVAVGRVVPDFVLTTGSEYRGGAEGCATHRYARFSDGTETILVAAWRLDGAADPYWIPNEGDFVSVDNRTLTSDGDHIAVVLKVGRDGTTARVSAYRSGASDMVAGWPTTTAPLPSAPPPESTSLTAGDLSPIAEAVLLFVGEQR